MNFKKRFINDCYDGDIKRYKQAREDDYCKVQLEWTYYIDGLCKDGIITEQERFNATF